MHAWARPFIYSPLDKTGNHPISSLDMLRLRQLSQISALLPPRRCSINTSFRVGTCLFSSTATTASQDGSPVSKASSFVQSILHGSNDAKEEERQTYSKLLARGKYVHELQSKEV